MDTYYKLKPVYLAPPSLLLGMVIAQGLMTSISKLKVSRTSVRPVDMSKETALKSHLAKHVFGSVSFVKISNNQTNKCIGTKSIIAAPGGSSPWTRGTTGYHRWIYTNIIVATSFKTWQMTAQTCSSIMFNETYLYLHIFAISCHFSRCRSVFALPESWCHCLWWYGCFWRTSVHVQLQGDCPEKKKGTWDLQFQPPQASAASAFSSTAQEWCKMLAKPHSHSPVLRAMCLAQPHPSAPTVQCNPAGKAAPLSICTFVERESLALWNNVK